MSIRQAIPSCITAAALLAGIFSILKAVSGEYMASSQFIMLSMILDGIDGKVARWLDASSEFGAELDTYVDLISFGVAPAILVYQVVLSEHGIQGVAMTCLIMLSGALRLARFKVIDEFRGQRGYLGLPITVCAGWLTLFVFVSEAGLFDSGLVSLARGPLAVFVWLSAMTMLVLQLTNVSYYKPTKHLLFLIVAILLVGLLYLRLEFAVAAALAVCVYGFIYAFITPFFHSNNALVEEEIEEPVG